MVLGHSPIGIGYFSVLSGKCLVCPELRTLHMVGVSPVLTPCWLGVCLCLHVVPICCGATAPFFINEAYNTFPPLMVSCSKSPIMKPPQTLTPQGFPDVTDVTPESFGTVTDYFTDSHRFSLSLVLTDSHSHQFSKAPYHTPYRIQQSQTPNRQSPTIHQQTNTRP
jgi:hypothetical protein